MVSDKLVVALIVIAILLSVISIVVTISSVNTKMIPELKPIPVGRTSDKQIGQVSLVINKPPTTP